MFNTSSLSANQHFLSTKKVESTVKSEIPLCLTIQESPWLRKPIKDSKCGPGEQLSHVNRSQSTGVKDCSLQPSNQINQIMSINKSIKSCQTKKKKSQKFSTKGQFNFSGEPNIVVLNFKSSCNCVKLWQTFTMLKNVALNGTKSHHKIVSSKNVISIIFFFFSPFSSGQQILYEKLSMADWLGC